MNIRHKIHRWVRLILSGMLLVAVTACAAGNAPASTEGELVTSSGFVCPEPSPRVEFESDTINIFTRTEYVPGDIFDCFGMV